MSGQKFPSNEDIMKLRKKTEKQLRKPDPTMLDNMKLISDRGTQRRKLNLKTGVNEVMEPYRKVDLKDLFKKGRGNGKKTK
jgi:hypothetical protein